MRGLAILAGALAVGCVGSGEGLDLNGRPIPPTTIHGVITDEQGSPIGPGVMFIEWGQLHGGDFRWETEVGADGTFQRELPTGGQAAPQFGFHWYFPGYFYIAKQITLHPNQDNNVNQVIYEQTDPSALATLPMLPAPLQGYVIPPTPDPTPALDPTLGNPKVDVLGGGLVHVQIDAYSPKHNLSEQILVATELGDAVKMNPPAPPDGGKYPDGTYSVTLSVPASAPATLGFAFVDDDLDCNNSTPLHIQAQVR